MILLGHHICIHLLIMHGCFVYVHVYTNEYYQERRLDLLRPLVRSVSVCWYMMCICVHEYSLY
ncbi:hypothetical protein EON63_12185 [archaeon]|nr:MAG: hypothetical protein EON63_12185 [archaeon]